MVCRSLRPTGFDRHLDGTASRDARVCRETSVDTLSTSTFVASLILERSRDCRMGLAAQEACTLRQELAPRNGRFHAKPVPTSTGANTGEQYVSRETILTQAISRATTGACRRPGSVCTRESRLRTTSFGAPPERLVGKLSSTKVWPQKLGMQLFAPA